MDGIGGNNDATQLEVYIPIPGAEPGAIQVCTDYKKSKKTESKTVKFDDFCRNNSVLQHFGILEEPDVP